VASNSSGRPNVVRLTAEQKEMASMMGMSPEDYAKNMVALKREGKLN
jgi:phage I-like protein